MNKGTSLRVSRAPRGAWSLLLLAGLFGASACVGSVERTYVDDTVDAAGTLGADAGNQGADSGPVDPAAKFAIGGLATGLSGSGLVLQNNSADDLAVSASGPFTFARKGKQGDAYAVSVKTQPSAPTQQCIVAGASGTIDNASVTNVLVSCTTKAFKVGGTLTGLGASQQVVLQNNSGDNLALTADGAFSFPTSVLSGAPYHVTVLTQPGLQTCDVTKATGNVGSADVADVAVSCGNNRYSVGGTASGVAGTGLQLTNATNGEVLAVAANGSFTFVNHVDDGGSFDVSVTGSPAGEACQITGGSGSISSANVSNLAVTCMYTENFDGVASLGQLPTGWSATKLSGVDWVTSSASSDTAPYALFADDPTTVSDKSVTSKAYAIQTATAQLTFRHSYSFESTGSTNYDGGVLEIAIPGVAGGAFQDILVAGGTAVQNGYIGPLDTCCSNPLPGRQAWTGTSPGFITTVLNLPAAAAGKSIQLRWRCGSDSSNGSTGWFVDSMTLRP